MWRTRRVVLSPAGELVASYRKCFPWQPYETSRPGTRTVCFDIDGIGRFGLAICHDGAFPEIFRSLAWQGAEAIFQVMLTEHVRPRSRDGRRARERDT